MEFILENWYYFVVGLGVLASAVLSVMKFVKQSAEKKKEQIRNWLLQAVILAEKEYGSGTGKLKLSSVYDSFCAKLPWLAKWVSFEKFSAYVDEVLVEMRELLSNNQSIAAVVDVQAV